MSKALSTSRGPNGRKFIKGVAVCYDKRRLNSKRARHLNNSPDFQRDLALLIEKHSQPDDRFRLVASFGIVVPERYDHDNWLAKFRRKHGAKFVHYNVGITDRHFAERATNKLVPGQRLMCKVFWIEGKLFSSDCLKFLKGQNAVLAGAQGASLAYEQGKDILPGDRFYASFDEKDALWEESPRCHRVPGVRARSGGVFDFILGVFEGGWGGGRTGLLCFCDA